MERRWIAFRSRPCPFPQRIQTYVDVLRAIAAFLATRSKNKEFVAVQADHFFWWLDEHAIPVRVVGAVELRAVQLRSADKGLNQVRRVRKAILREIGRS